jgi:hypothetical protein
MSGLVRPTPPKVANPESRALGSGYGFRARWLKPAPGNDMHMIRIFEIAPRIAGQKFAVRTIRSSAVVSASPHTVSEMKPTLIVPMKWPFLESPRCRHIGALTPVFGVLFLQHRPKISRSPDRKVRLSIVGPSETLYHIAAAQVSRGRDLLNCGCGARGRGFAHNSRLQSPCRSGGGT